MKSITVYSTPTCPYCHQLKGYLKENDVEFVDKNVAEDTAARDEMVQKSGQLGVPVSVIGDDDVIVGFDKEKISELLGIGA